MSEATMQKDKPILFGAPMVRALLAGTKTQTRRSMKLANGKCESPMNQALGDAVYNYSFDEVIERARWRVGDRLWVREAWSPEHKWSGTKPRDIPNGDDIWYWADGNPQDGDWTKPKPSIHMPRWVSRITLEVVAVRVERLQAISEADAVAEGVDACDGLLDEVKLCQFAKEMGEPATENRVWYRALWEMINGPGSWDANPWVSVTTFRRINPSP